MAQYLCKMETMTNNSDMSLYTPYKDLKPIIPAQDCQLCPDMVKSRKFITWGYGSLESTIVFVGEAPGRNGAAKTGIPFTLDRSGEYFQKTLDYLGLDFSKVYTTNLVKCNPLGLDKCNRTPSMEERLSCSKFIRYELKQIKPIVIVTLGALALSFFTLRSLSYSIKQGHFTDPEFNAEIFPLYHPAYALRKDWRVQYYAEMMRPALNYLAGRLEHEGNKNYHKEV